MNADTKTRSQRLLGLIGVLAVAGSVVVLGQRAPIDLNSLFESYSSGDYDAAVERALAVEDGEMLRRQYRRAADQWIAAAPDKPYGRRAVAAGLILEIAHARMAADWRRLSEVVEWACGQLRSSGPPTAFERAWDEASIAVASRARDRAWLIGNYADLPRKGVGQRFDARESGDQHLIHVLHRFPADPRFELARVVAWIWGRDSEPMRNMTHKQIDVSRRLVGQPPQLAALIPLELLAREPEVAAEALIRAGWVLFSVTRYEDALHSFESAVPPAHDGATKYLAHFSAGRAFESLGQRDGAIRSFERALEAMPDAESAAIALADLQFGTDYRGAAIGRLERVFSERRTQADPGRLVGYGSYAHWPRLKAAMRAGLPR